MGAEVCFVLSCKAAWTAFGGRRGIGKGLSTILGVKNEQPPNVYPYMVKHKINRSYLLNLAVKLKQKDFRTGAMSVNSGAVLRRCTCLEAESFFFSCTLDLAKRLCPRFKE